ncbi:MAG TPA: hypothetical protein IAC64_04065 [Candidatus Caccomorpha excrementavium]|nr:hypothetical protein [Candidatus Caccomorpha excrementavium]
MNELYAEAGCKRLNTMKVVLQKTGLIAVVVIVFLLAILTLNQILMFVGMLGIIGLVFFLPRLNVEYEYIFVDGQLDFDKIMGGARRKTAMRIQIEQIEIVAPAGSHTLDSYSNNSQVKIKDFSSGDPNAKVYVVMHRQGETLTKILFEPDEKMLACMKQKSPRKIVEY